MNELPLKDIHLPASVSWWPPAPGWWLLAGLLLVAMLFAVHGFRRGRDRRRLRRAAGLELKHLEQALKAGYARQQLVRELSALLRRLALSLYPRERVASLTGAEWLAFLDRSMGAPVFSRGPGRLLASAPYAPDDEVDMAALLELARAWVERVSSTPAGADP